MLALPPGSPAILSGTFPSLAEAGTGTGEMRDGHSPPHSPWPWCRSGPRGRAVPGVSGVLLPHPWAGLPSACVNGGSLGGGISGASGTSAGRGLAGGVGNPLERRWAWAGISDPHFLPMMSRQFPKANDRPVKLRPGPRCVSPCNALVSGSWHVTWANWRWNYQICSLLLALIWKLG